MIMKCINRLSSTFFFLVISLNAFCDSISEEQALNIAARFFSPSINMAKGGTVSLSVAKASVGYYAINRGQNDGYVIVASNDNIGNEVLGYADSGNIDTLNIPDGLNWLLSVYDSQVPHISNHTVTTITRSTDRNAITPLLACLWDQGSPYSDKCPTYKGTACTTGCVATALSQIMYYHKWPKQGTGNVSYDWYINNMKYQTLTADLSQSTYDWDSMTDTYNSTSSDEAKTAVARLMADVGMASEMQYSPNGSGAYTYTAAKAMATNFGYDKGLRYVMRDFYTHDEWEDMLYGELAASRPVFYAGSDKNNSGHAFVLDGYNDGYYHINWGWGGTSNGYFLLTDLTPNEQGAGGSGNGFSYSNEAIIGLCPAMSGSTEQPVLYNYSGISTLTSAATPSSTVWFNVAIISVSLSSRNLSFGLKVVDSSSNDTQYVAGEFTELLNPYITQNNNFVTGYQVKMSNFPTTSGTYLVYPACYDNSLGKWIDIPTITTSSSLAYLVATVNGNRIRFKSPTLTSASLKATDVTLSTKLYAKQEFMGMATFTATDGDYYGDIRVGFTASATSTTFSTYGENTTLIDIADGTSQQQSFTSTAPSLAGTYYMAIVDANGNPISDKVKVTVNDTPSSTLAFTAQGISMTSTNEVDPLDINITFKVKCTGGFYSGCFYAYFFGEGEQTSYVYLLSDNVVMAEGDEATIIFSGSVSQLAYNKKYTAYITYDGNYINPHELSGITFTTAASSGIEGVASDCETRLIRIYSLDGTLATKQSGVKADLSKLPKGVYIVKIGEKARKVIND